jgi:hypothetical protein
MFAQMQPAFAQRLLLLLFSHGSALFVVAVATAELL